MVVVEKMDPSLREALGHGVHRHVGGKDASEEGVSRKHFRRQSFNE